jgi:hypothetical protein
MIPVGGYGRRAGTQPLVFRRRSVGNGSFGCDDYG